VYLPAYQDTIIIWEKPCGSKEDTPEETPANELKSRLEDDLSVILKRD